MKLSPRSLLCALAFGLALTPAVSLAEYQLPERALDQLEHCVMLTPDQEKQALQIFQNLKDIMDSMSPADRMQKGMQSRQDAKAAIRSILTPQQQEIYDKTPQRLGGGAGMMDPAMQALNLKIRNFVINAARTSPKVAAKVGTIQKVVSGGNDTRSFFSSQTEKYDDPALHPDSGSSSVRVTGSSGVKVFTVSWKMDNAGVMTLDKIALKST